MRCASVALAAIALAPLPLAAQEGNTLETGLVPLKEITVSGTGIPTEVMYSPASVTVVGENQIREVPPSSVAQVLSEIPGIRVTEQGIERLRIRGESSQRVAIMIDGQAISDHTNYGTPVLIAPTEIARIEVVRGPSSVVSGNRAIGGVVNIITKRGADGPAEVSVTGGYVGPNEGYRAAASIAGTVGSFDYRLSLSQSELGDRETPNGPLVPSDSSDRDIHAFLGYRTGNHYFGLRMQDYDLSANVYTGVPNFLISLPKRDLRKYSAFYEGSNLTPWMSSLKLSAFSETVEREFRNDVSVPAGPMTMRIISDSDDEQTTSGFRAVANMEFAPGHRTVAGFEYEDDRLLSNKISTTTMVPPVAPPTVSTAFSDATIRTGSLFAQHEATFGALTGTVGLRYYNVKGSLDRYVVNGVVQPGRSNNDDRLLGSFGLVYALSDQAVLRASVSQGYTYPSLSQLFLTSSGGGGTVIGNPNLRPETATNYEVGARIDRGNLSLDFAMFYTQAKDYIAAVATGAPRTSMYQNVNNVDSWGFEVAAEFDPGWQSGIRPYLSVANVTREFDYGNGFVTKDSGTPEWTGTVGLRGDWSARGLSGTWDLFAQGESQAVQRDATGAVVDQTGGWGTLNLRGSVDLTQHAVLTFEAGNLFDKAYRPIDQIDGPGRYLSVFLSATF